jgi:hypothetical protein
MAPKVKGKTGFVFFSGNDFLAGGRCCILDSDVLLSLSFPPCLPLPEDCRMSPRPATTVLALCLLLIGVFAGSPQIFAQTVCLPLPRLLSITPMGGQAGTVVDVTVAGEFLDDQPQLMFSDRRLSVAPQTLADGTAVSGKFRITIPADCPSGLYEARLLTRLGISSSRVFSVGNLPEQMQQSGSTAVATAMPLSINSVCNSQMSARSIDHYRFEAEAGVRYVITCESRSIESKLDPVLVLANAAGQDLIVERQRGLIDFTAKVSGSHVIKVHELTYKGGTGYFYRLGLRQLATTDSPPILAAIRPVRSFSWPPAGLPTVAAVTEHQPDSSSGVVQSLTLPCDVMGSFATAADTDVFEFTAKKGQVWWVEVASERLGRPTDPAVVIQRVVSEGGQERLADVVEFSDIPSPMKPSSNGYSYDGPPYDGGSADPLGRFEAPEDGRYQLRLTDLFGGTRTDPANIWRLVIREAAPDFALCAWGLHMELRNGDRNALSKPLALRGGITTALEVIALRRDGFDGPIDLTVTGLPEGVTASGLQIPAGQNRGIVLLTADQNAPRSFAFAQMSGAAKIGDVQVVRPCSIAAMSWPVVDAWSEIPSPRLLDDLAVSVCGSEYAPVSIAPRDRGVHEVVAGQKLTLPMLQTRRAEFSGNILQLRTLGSGFQQHPQFDVSLTVDTFDVVFDTAALKTAPGDYLIAFYGSAVARYSYNPEGVQKAQQELDAARVKRQAAAAVVEQATAALAAAASENRADPEKVLQEAQAALKAAEDAVLKAEQSHKAAAEQAAPKDTAEIIVSEPISIRVKSAEAK